MRLTLKQFNGVKDLAKALQNFLPGSGASSWKGHVNFGTVAAELGLSEYWPQSGSKLPRLVSLLQATLEYRPERFEPLIVGIVRKGLTYREAQKDPVRSAEVEGINGALLEVGMRLPDLWDPAFRDALSRTDVERAQTNLSSARFTDEVQSTERANRSSELQRLQQELCALTSLSDRQAAGLSLERLLNSLFKLEGLVPRSSFRVIGEQIDGSFVLDNEVYLLEAKWHVDPSPEADLLVFRGKIEGKSAFTRGVFVSLNGVSASAQDAITRGKQPNFFVMTGHDLMMVLSNAIGLVDLLRRRQRVLSEEGAVVVEFARVK
ncbi:MAG: hypothetical protein SFV15_19310 [Polyangiaceae bacterium]|nr:hypothetical protein [Polyangiaceae bacterium]